MFVLFVKMKPKPEHQKEFLRLLTEEIATALKHEPGIVRFDILQAPDDPGTCYAYEVYQDKAAFEHHRQQPYFKEFTSKTKGWYEATPAIGGFPSYTTVYPPDSSFTHQAR